ncbi:MAG: acetate--CoA ligase family protein [Thermoguttaceae bacterium]|jgi:acetyltransferase|nr:acetate--CoA ligase family protein [Thermoguttaceae bacterium]
MTVKERNAKLADVFHPQSVAVIGASTRPSTVGNDIFRNLLLSGFNGSVYPVNPKSPHVLGVHAYPSLSDIPAPVDLAVVIVRADTVQSVVEEGIAKGVKGFIVISAGFKEIGAEGARREARLRDCVREADVPLIGPNCLGVINTDPAVSMNAAFGRKMPAAGNLAFLSQSGALCTSVLDYAEERHMGFSKFVSFGNKADVNEVDLLEYLATDEKTSVIAMYLEDISDGRRFIEKVRDIFWKTGKPMLCLKSGRSPEGAKAVSSHTGSLAGSDSVYDALLIQSGVQRVDTIAELFDYAALYTTQPLPRGNRVAIITNAGGPGIMATDAAVRHGLKLAELSESTTVRLRASLPATAALRNPIDVIGDARHDRYKAAVHTVLEDDNVDMGVVILTPQSMTDIEQTAAIVPQAVAGIDKPVVCAFMGAKDVAPGVDVLRRGGVPNYAFPEDAVRSLAAAARLVELQEIPRRETPKLDGLKVDEARSFIQKMLDSSPRRYLHQAECRPLLGYYGLPLLKSEVAHNPEEAGRIAESIGGKVVLKVMSPDVVHKVDAGGVILGIEGPEEAAAAYARIVENVHRAMPDAKIEGILVEQMAPKGVEVILGASRDERFGPLMMFGLGGTLVEVLKDVSFRLAPMWQISAERMVRQIRSFEVLDGFRGNPPCDIDSIVRALMRLSEMLCNHPEIAEVDINPLIVHPRGEGCSVADSRIVLTRPE